MKNKYANAIVVKSFLEYRGVVTDNLKSLSKTILYDMTNYAKKSPSAIANGLLQYWTTDQTLWLDSEDYSDEEIVMVNMAIVLMRELIGGLRKSKRQSISKHMLKSLEKDEDFWTQEVLESGDAKIMVNALIKQFNL